jgi:hypothetical protein
MKTNREIGLAKRRALRIIRKVQPKVVIQLEATGLKLREIKIRTRKGMKGNGAFRRAYEIVGTGLVVKFPRPEYSRGVGWVNAEHTRDEVKKIRALSQYCSLRPHMPPVYYYNGRDGVMVTDYYPFVCPDKAKNVILSDVIFELTGIPLDDVMGDNVRMKETGNPVFVDCGY